MKPQQYIIGLLILAFSLLQSVNAQSIQEQLIGVWTFDYNKSLTNMRQQSKDYYYNKISSKRKARLISVYKDRKIYFHANGSYEQILSDGRTSTASWFINNSNNLIIKTPEGKLIEFEVKEIQPNTLTISQINKIGSSMNILFTNWCLIKN